MQIPPSEVVSDGARRAPCAALRPFVRPYEGYRTRGLAPGEHVGMPGPYLTVIVAMEPSLEIARAPRQGAGVFETLASGITTSPVTIVHNGNQSGIQLSLTPLGSRALLGVPTAELGEWLVDLDEVLGADAVELRERVCAAPEWAARFDVVDEILLRRLRECEVDSRLIGAWHALTSGSVPKVADVALDIGWSRRHLVSKFSSEFGVGPKEAVRIARFYRSHRRLRDPACSDLAAVASECGFYDQPHMNREWRVMAGMSPTTWREREMFSFFQDSAAGDEEGIGS
ncbi:AraC family transcriptional regulator [Rhodococcus ruber]|uniref:AraC family transcriptional regulator n=1 Tax=Rhodococcus ruber TaxID=1830 RepID=A0ABT4MIP4_9NOCA|nr:AraC family transcriptional regulator [Rhodococcus ruber]MCZ4520843.1 AraC family transcriptional regulator [Rhodococcus ruber]